MSGRAGARCFWDVWPTMFTEGGQLIGIWRSVSVKDRGRPMWSGVLNSLTIRLPSRPTPCLDRCRYRAGHDEVFLKGGTVKRGLAEIAAKYAKTDLTTELVKEFTELQGIIGGLYIRAQWQQEGYIEHNAAIADAIYSQYIPASMEDAIPATAEGQLLGLADRIQTIVAMFGIGQAPTGSKDPFALRRSANAIVKILAESKLPLTLEMYWSRIPGKCGLIRVASLFLYPVTLIPTQQ